MIETPRLLLAQPTLADFDESYAIGSDEAVVRYIGGKPASREDAWTKLLRNIGHWSAFGFGIFTVREREGGAHVGEVGFAFFARGFGERFDRFPEAAWVLAPASQGKGYASEAVIATHAWMDNAHQPARTVCIIHPDNAESMRIAGKRGYRAVGEVSYRGAAPRILERGSKGAVPALG